MASQDRHFNAANIAKNAEHEQDIFVNSCLRKLPKHWQKKAFDKHSYLVKTASVYAANSYLKLLVEPISFLLDIARDDDDLKALAKDTAKQCSHFLGTYADTSSNLGLDVCQEYCISYGVRFPVEFDKDQIAARLTCNIWWLRKLRNSHARAREMVAIDAGLVNKSAAMYCSDDTLERRFQQLKRNAELLKGAQMVCKATGQIMNLADIAKTGMANHEVRRAELTTRLSGFEELKTKYNHAAEFITVTCPSRMHAVLSDGQTNKKYDGTKPDQAQRYLVEAWARVRAKLAREGVKFYGLRICEPHHDATPHWHLVLFFKPENGNLDTIKSAFIEHFLADSPNERGAKENRIKFVSCRQGKSAVAYMLKYICKNLGGIDGELSDEGKLSSETAGARVEAWASTWRIRQFQQIGGHSVTVWRELRRVEGGTAKAAGLKIFEAWKAAQKVTDHKANFAEFIESMGGLDTKPRESIIALDVDYITKRGRYGEIVAGVLVGVVERFGMGKAINNREEWTRV